ncbi:MAG: hypothetical protein ACO289_10335 [Prochlorococcaceae cyanobacterium]
MLHSAFVEVPMAGTRAPQDTTCLARTCLTWTPEGELSAEDRALVLERLQLVDNPLSSPDLQPCER